MREKFSNAALRAQYTAEVVFGASAESLFTLRTLLSLLAFSSGRGCEVSLQIAVKLMATWRSILFTSKSSSVNLGVNRIAASFINTSISVNQK